MMARLPIMPHGCYLKMGSRKPLFRRGASYLLIGFAFLLSACSLPTFGPTPSRGDTSPVPQLTGAVSPTPIASPTPKSSPTSITLQVVGCPTTLTINWDKLAGTQAGVNKVQKVMCGSLEGAGSLVALVNARSYASDSSLNVYAYDNLTGTPRQTFALKGLIDGEAFISSAGTIATAEIGANDSVRTLPDVFREYQWNGSSFTQVFFPWIYPDMTRYQADQDQASVAAGADPWKLSGSEVSAHLAQFVFHWDNTTSQVLLNSQQNNIVEVSITNNAPGGGGFVATLHHLDGITTNIYEVEKIVSINGTASVSSPAPGVQLTSPVNVSGSFVVTSNVVGQVLILDDSFFTVGSSGTISAPASSGSVVFTTTIRYQLKTQGLEDGVVLFLPTNQNNINLSNQAVMYKVILSS